jgi:hypothetical protein
MKRIPASQQVRQEISSSLSEGIEEEGSILAQL